jgi:hypothetical protein
MHTFMVQILGTGLLPTCCFLNQTEPERNLNQGCSVSAGI